MAPDLALQGRAGVGAHADHGGREDTPTAMEASASAPQCCSRLRTGGRHGRRDMPAGRGRTTEARFRLTRVGGG
jgi:hypothetical protein